MRDGCFRDHATASGTTCPGSRSPEVKRSIRFRRRLRHTPLEASAYCKKAIKRSSWQWGRLIFLGITQQGLQPDEGCPGVPPITVTRYQALRAADLQGAGTHAGDHSRSRAAVLEPKVVISCPAALMFLDLRKVHRSVTVALM